MADGGGVIVRRCGMVSSVADMICCSSLVLKLTYYILCYIELITPYSPYSAFLFAMGVFGFFFLLRNHVAKLFPLPSLQLQI